MAFLRARCFRFFAPRRKENFFLCLLLIFGCFFFVCLVQLYVKSHKEDVVEARRPHRRVDDMGENLNEKIARNEQTEFHIVPNYGVPRHGPGEDGAPVIMQTAEERRLSDESMKMWFMNLVASDRISNDRSLPDNRMPDCKKIHYDVNELPNVSVVIIFNNEAWSPLIRTVHSVYNRSPPQLLHEIVLLDDASDREELGSKLDDYIKRFRGKVKLVRKTVRQGLIRARLEGAKAATGQVLFFLDSHCEANIGWLEPIVARIKEKRSAILCPMIDAISDRTMSYPHHWGEVQVGGFSWNLFFTWIPRQSSQNHKAPHEPVNSPTMAGGLFAADRNYFFEIGGYDPGMDIWGGENLELSFRTWMCGGSLEYIPCSHVGHIFRSGHPYNMTNKDVHGYNSARLAEVWLDDYKRLYYRHRRDLRNASVGDLSERVALRKRLHCKSFRWFLENIYPEKFVLDENVVAFGMFKNVKSQMCLDTLQRDEKHTIDLAVFTCQGGQSAAQLFSLSRKNELRREELCADCVGNDGETVKLMNCHGMGQNQEWIHVPQTEQLMHSPSKKCLDVKGLTGGNNIVIQKCDPESETQKWTISNA